MQKPRVHIFDLLIRVLIVLLPFTTLLSVFFKVKLGLPFFTYYKECILIGSFCILAWLHIRGRLRIKWTLTDTLIALYIVTMIAVTLFTTGIPGLIYGGRYDFEFLLMFWVVYHGSSLLKESVAYYLRLFLISTGVMLFFSALLKWPLTEDLLLSFGYCGNPSAWAQCNGIPPIFHGIDGANIRRFQGILDGPNTMGAFLILFSGIFAYFLRQKRDWYFVIGIFLIGFLIMITYTSSRSAALGILFGYGIIIIAGLPFLIRRYKKQFIILLCMMIVLGGVGTFKYADKAGAIIGREGSTQGHIERMKTSFERFQSHPMGQGLASAGPASRFIPHPDVLTESQKKDTDSYFIPESWFIQQFVEGGFVGGILFILITFSIWISLYKRHIILAGMFAGVLVMNLFLHTFESSPFSLLLFTIIAIILGKSQRTSNILER